MSLRVGIETHIVRLQRDVKILQQIVKEQSEEIKKLREGYYK